nr:hypothetical protein [Tanacetum cinerariifolium]
MLNNVRLEVEEESKMSLELLSEIQKQESLVSKGATLECLVNDAAELEACLIAEGASIEACLVTEGASLEACLVNEVTEIPYSSNDTFKNMFAHEIQSHEQPKSFLDTYEVNENNSNIISDIPNMDPNSDKKEHDDVDYEQQRALFASLINNLKCDVEKCNEVNYEAQQANALLTNELERYKEKGKHFAKDMTIESEYSKRLSF